MTGRIPRYFIDDLLSRVDIVDLIDKHVPLKKAGANFVARCPFHTEKTPSFSVNRNKQFFHCFGCGASGNAIGFLMDFNHLDFIEAVEDLATFAGLEVPRETIETSGKHLKSEFVSDYYQLLEQVAAFYVQCLRTDEEGKKAISYLKSRGITDSLAKDFMIGFAPDEWRVLSSRFDQNQLVQAGMSIEKEGKVYDRFRGRLMFPIRDKRGRTVGFGGRVLNDTLPKYLNSPETSVFHKSKEVYGLYELLRKDSKPKRILVVEGYLDVIALAGNGIHYAVATLGTSTSLDHLELLFRFASELVLCFDGDSAGQKAAWRAVSSVFPALKAGRQIRIMVLPEQHDPDSLINKEGKELFDSRINNSQPLSEYFYEHFTKDLKLSEIENLSFLLGEAEEYLKKLPIGSFRELMVDKLSGLSNRHVLDRQAMLAYSLQVKKHRQKSNRLSVASSVLALLIQNPRLIALIEKKDIDWNYLDFEGIEKFRQILDVLLTKRPVNYGVLIEHYRDHPNETIIKKLATVEFPDENIEKLFLESINRLFVETNAALIDKLLEKSKKDGLSKSEKEDLVALLAKKHSDVIL
ncbi:MAG: DNA primase [Methylococcaceae bacterium]|nr:DNA primase [Methylococcaceae bacterium]